MIFWPIFRTCSTEEMRSWEIWEMCSRPFTLSSPRFTNAPYGCRVATVPSKTSPTCNCSPAKHTVTKRTCTCLQQRRSEMSNWPWECGKNVARHRDTGKHERCYFWELQALTDCCMQIILQRNVLRNIVMLRFFQHLESPKQLHVARQACVLFGTMKVRSRSSASWWQSCSSCC